MSVHGIYIYLVGNNMSYYYPHTVLWRLGNQPIHLLIIYIILTYINFEVNWRIIYIDFYWDFTF
jgi:hypothetical protein